MTRSSQIPDASCVKRLKLLADPTRLALVRLLTRGPQHVKDLNADLRVDQNLLSHHLKVLREGGLCVAERDGKAVTYRLVEGVYDINKGGSIDLGCCSLAFPNDLNAND